MFITAFFCFIKRYSSSSADERKSSLANDPRSSGDTKELEVVIASKAASFDSWVSGKTFEKHNGLVTQETNYRIK